MFLNILFISLTLVNDLIIIFDHWFISFLVLVYLSLIYGILTYVINIKNKRAKKLNKLLNSYYVLITFIISYSYFNANLSLYLS